MSDEKTPDERMADAVEDLCTLFARAFSTGAATSNGGGVVEHNGMALSNDLASLTTIVGEGLESLTEAVNELNRTMQDFMHGSYIDSSEPPPDWAVEAASGLGT